MKLELKRLKIEERIAKEKDKIIELNDIDKKDILIEVEFKGSRKEYFLNPKSVPLSVGCHTIIEYDNGEDMGVVSSFVNKNIKGVDLSISGKIIRKCNNIDIRRLKENRKIEDQILVHARLQAKKYNLEMKFIDIEYKFDRKKLVFFFTADGRIDFRELVKNFASEYRTRIELRQIGVRDEAQRIGGIGICGFELCCSKFLKNFTPINVSMARDQNLFVKPEKFSGACGKLMCCLKYEHDFYTQTKRGLPEVGTGLMLKKGRADVSNIDVFSKIVTINYRSGNIENIPIQDFIEIINKLPKNKVFYPQTRSSYESNDLKKVTPNNSCPTPCNNEKCSHREKSDNQHSKPILNVVERIVQKRVNNKDSNYDNKINIKVKKSTENKEFIKELEKKKSNRSNDKKNYKNTQTNYHNKESEENKNEHKTSYKKKSHSDADRHTLSDKNKHHKDYRKKKEFKPRGK